MARIRTIKPEFWHHEDLSALAPETHMLAAALLNYADDEGYFNANPRLVKSQCLPLREDSTSIRRSLDELSRVGYIRLFEGFDGKQYGHIVTFLDHQRIDRPKESKIKGLEDSTKDRRSIDEESTPEGKGREQGKEQGKDTSDGSGEPPSTQTQPKAKRGQTEYPAEFEQLWAQYPQRAGGNPKPAALKAYQARIRDGVSHDDLMAGVLRYASFCEQQGKTGTEFVKQAATFLGPNEHWREEYRPPAKPAMTVHNGGLRPAVDNSEVARRWAAKQGGAA